MSGRIRLRPGFLAAVVAFGGWMAFWSWAFSLSYGPQFLTGHLASRLPPLLLSLAAVAAPPLVAASLIRSFVRGSPLTPRRGARFLGVAALPLVGLTAWYFLAGLVTGRAAWWSGPEPATLSSAFVDVLLCALVLATATVVAAAGGPLAARLGSTGGQRAGGDEDGSFDRAYRSVAAYFGDEPDPLLVRCADVIPPGRPVLDLGAGQGRHALWLARRGTPVVAVDPSVVAARTVLAAARSEGLPIVSVLGSFAALGGEGIFGGVLLFGLVQLLPPPAIARLTERSATWLTPGGVLLLTAFGTADGSFAEVSRTWTHTGRNCFRNAAGEYRTFLEPGEALTLLPGWEVLHHQEGSGPVHRHGDGPAERHHRVELALRKPG